VNGYVRNINLNPEYRRQWRKLHIGIDAKTLQIRAVQLTTNNVGDSQVLGDLLDQMTQNNVVRSLQIGKRMQ